MTPYRDRLHNDEYAPDTEPKQPKDFRWTDRQFLKKTGHTTTSTTKTTAAKTAAKTTTAIIVTALTLLIPGTALADPDFGPGNSSKGPNDGGAKCHPPGQTVTEPGCK